MFPQPNPQSIYDAPSNGNVPFSALNSPTFAPPPLPAASVNYPTFSTIQLHTPRTPQRNSRNYSSSTRSSSNNCVNRDMNYNNRRNNPNVRNIRNIFLNQFVSYLLFVVVAFYFLYDLLRNGAFDSKNPNASAKSLFKIGFVLLLSILTKPINFN